MMRNFTPIYRFFSILILSILTSNIQVLGQNYDVTLPQQCNPTTGGNETLIFSNVPPNANGDATLTFAYNGDLNGTPTNPEFITFIDENGSTIGQSNATAQCGANYDSVSFIIPLATILNWASDGTVTIIADGDATINNICSGNSFCVIARLRYPVVTGPNDIGVASLDSPGTFFCSGNYNLVTTVQNYGTNQVNNYTVNWTWNGTPETPILVTTPLDTINGSGANSAQITLGNKLITGTNTLKVWTSVPNGAVDTVNVNDTLEVTLSPSIQAPSNLFASNVLSNSALLNWTEIGSSSQWEIEYGPSGFVLGSGSSVVTSNNPFSLTGLSSNTSYDYYVRSICGAGDTSSFTGPANFITTCTIFPNPYFEDFDNGNWPVGGATIDQCWSRSPTVGYSWRGNTGTTSSTATGPTGDVNGPGTYVYPEASSGSVGATSTLTTPPVDVSNLTAPQLDFNYHRFGNGMGDFHVIVNGVSTTDTVLTLLGVDPNYTSINDPWTFISVPLTNFANDTITISFVSSIGSTGSSFNADMCLDEIRIYQPIPEDFSVIAIDSPLTGCALTANETLSTRIINFGSATFNSGFAFPIEADINGLITTETITLGSTFAPGDTLSYTFTTPIDLSATGGYNFKVYTQLPGDSSNTNDTAFALITNIPTIVNYPYSEDFDSGPGGWTTTGTNPWQLGAPAGSVINTAASSPNAWMTNLSGGYPTNDVSFVTGPCFNFDSLIVPEVNVSINWNTNFSWDGVQMQYSTDAGMTWNKVSSFGDPNSTNWYNDNTVDGLQAQFTDGDGWSGNGTTGSNGWLVASADLSNVAGQSDVLFRMAFASSFLTGSFDGVAFDNFQIVETALPFNLELIEILSPGSGCGLTATESVQIEYANVGLNAVTSGTTINFSYYLDGVATNENFVLTADLLPGDTALYTFTAPVDLSVPATYQFGAKATFSLDQNPLNDSLGFALVSIPIISNYPYSENFDSGPGGWLASGNTTWALGTPAGPIINSPASAPNSWVTNLTGPYINNEDGVVTGPCFAFDSLIAPEVSIDIWWDSETGWDGMQLQTSLDGGATWQKVSFLGDPNSTNWYNGNFNGLLNAGADGEGWGGRFGNESGGWLTATADLSSLSGQPDALFRMQFGSDGSVTGEGVAFDNFQLVETALPFNVELIDIISPVSGCGLSATDTVILEYANIGLNTITTGTTLNFSYYLNGVATNENLVLASDLFPGDTAFYTFTSTVDLSVPATYAFGAIATFSADQNPLDDSLGLDIISIPVISSFPYYEDFESGNGGWTSGGTNSSWALGTPATANISGASSGVNAWNTNLTGVYNANEEAFVLGPCFDFSSLTLPLIKIDVNWNSEFSWDGAQVQASTNAGATWTPVGAFGDPDNWYTDNTVNGLSFTNQEGWTGRATSNNGSNGWLTAENNLNSYAGNSGVLMRVVFGSDGSVQDEGFAFDNFHILESPNNDIKVDSLFGLQSGCGYTANTPITMRVTNKGILPQSNIPVFYTVNGTPSPTETIPGPINPGSTFVYNFTNNADLSVPQTYTVIGRSALPTDEDTTNDASSAKIFASLFTPVVDSVANGETCESGPVTLEVFSTGDTDRWFDVPIGGSPLGTGSTYTLANVTQDDTLYVESLQSTTGCNSVTISGRVPVYAFHSTTPVINFTSQVTGSLTITFSSSLSPNVDSVLWDFGDGTFATAANPQHTFPQSQSYLITLTAYAGSCIKDTTKAVFVPVGGINDNAYTNLNVFPNPSDGSFRISAENISGEVNIEILSMTGTVVYSEKAQAMGEELNHDIRLNQLAQGTYILKIRNDKTLINGRIVIE
ncbi:MAG: T9SS type A sorting domain-containing protein [Cytophagales bacterium]